MERCILIGNSPATLRLVDLANRVSRCDTSALLVGPPGSEFDIVAQFIHQQSTNAGLPFTRQRCIGWEDRPDSRLWNERGTLFIEGIEHASLPLQVRLLSELEEFRSPLARPHERPRIIASTNKSLPELVSNGLFLEDLYWQLSAVTIEVPSLSERSADIAELAEKLLTQISDTHRLASCPRLTAAAIQQMQAYDWPGNFRELVSKLVGAALLSTQPELSLSLVPESATDHSRSAACDLPRTEPATKNNQQDFQSLVQAVIQRGIVEADRNHRELHQYIVDHVESALISAILAECEHVQTKTATRLGINRNTLHKKMKDFGLETGISDK